MIILEVLSKAETDYSYIYYRYNSVLTTMIFVILSQNREALILPWDIIYIYIPIYIYVAFVSSVVELLRG